jgi:hypothetical protein
VYQQTIQAQGSGDPAISVKGSLPQTFLDVAAKQSERPGHRAALYCQHVKTGTEHDQSL